MLGDPVAVLFCWLCCWAPGPATTTESAADSFVPSLVQIAPRAAQSVVASKVSVTEPDPDGSTVIRQPRLLPRVSRLALRMRPPLTVKAWSRTVT